MHKGWLGATLQSMSFPELASLCKDFDLIPEPVNYASLLDVFVMTKAQATCVLNTWTLGVVLGFRRLH